MANAARTAIQRMSLSIVFICLGLVVGIYLVMAMNPFSMPFVVGVAALLIVAAVTEVHSLMSGTAAADFGGRKATATASGIVDGFVYLGSGVQSVGVGYLVTHHSWQWWPIFLMPFALIGGLMAWRMWHELPAATRVYIATVERKELALASANGDSAPTASAAGRF
jgi:OPA family glycerol-3-phosphate transporter-like MFS transporter